MTVGKKSVFIALVTAIIVMFTAVCACLLGAGGLTFKAQAQEQEHNEGNALLSQEKINILKDNYALYKQLPSNGAAMAMSIGETQEDNTAIRQSYPLYDFNGELIAYCAVFDRGYSIINAVTDTVYETGAANPYEGYTDNKLIYVSPTVYGYKNNDGYYLTSSDSKLNEAAITHLQNAWEELQIRDMQDKAADEGIQTLAASAPDMTGLQFIYSGDISNIDKGLYFFLLDRFDDIWDGNKDFYFPNNSGSTCAIVAMVMLLQFYERNNIVDLIPDEEFYSTFPFQRIRSLSKTEKLHKFLLDNANRLPGGAIMTNEIVRLFNWYFNRYGYSAKATYNAFYRGMKASIDDNRPAIGEIGIYDGYRWNISDDTFTDVRVPSHQVV
ncbi:MAG: hypothetical protein K2I79_00900, partial [Clostridia bacterium]|nr:hypothetical protein [Clostridia bacterium]